MAYFRLKNSPDFKRSGKNKQLLSSIEENMSGWSTLCKDVSKTEHGTRAGILCG